MCHIQFYFHIRHVIFPILPFHIYIPLCFVYIALTLSPSSNLVATFTRLISRPIFSYRNLLTPSCFSVFKLFFYLPQHTHTMWFKFLIHFYSNMLQFLPPSLLLNNICNLAPFQCWRAMYLSTGTAH